MEGVEWSGVEGSGGEGRGGQGRVPDCLGGLSRVGILSRSTRPWNGQPPSFDYGSSTCCKKHECVKRNPQNRRLN